MFGTRGPRGPEGPRGPDTGRSELKHIDVLPLDRTLGMKQYHEPRTGIKEPRPLNIHKLIMRGFPSLPKKMEE